MCTGTDSLSKTHCEHHLSQEHLLKPRNYQQLASSAQFEHQLASSLYSVGFILHGSRSTVGFITRDFHALISRQHSQTNRRGLHTLFLTSKSRCMQKIRTVDALLTIGCPDPVASSAAIPDEANCRWLHQSHHCGFGMVNNRPGNIRKRVDSAGTRPRTHAEKHSSRIVKHTQGRAHTHAGCASWEQQNKWN